MLGNRFIVSPRRVVKQGSNYVITIPKPLGKILYGKYLQVTLEILEDVPAKEPKEVNSHA